MECQNITGFVSAGAYLGHFSGLSHEEDVSFESILFERTASAPRKQPKLNPSFALSSSDMTVAPAPEASSGNRAIAAYEEQINHARRMSGWEKYKDDQLLSNPGGDHYYWKEKKVVSEIKDQDSFLGRIEKDVSDAFSNVKNFFKNLFWGSKIQYRDENNCIREAAQRGVIGSLVDFAKDLLSAFSFGMWDPDQDAGEQPTGFVERMGSFFSGIKKAVFGDLVQGVSGGVIRMGEDLLLAGWNLVEVVPDATVGNLPGGRELTTAIFDNGQVVIDYLTDILPTGEAWLRVHASDLKDLKVPILYNISLPEHYKGDVRWQYVRNTPFRKTIETIGSLLADIISAKLLDDVKFSSEERRKRN